MFRCFFHFSISHSGEKVHQDVLKPADKHNSAEMLEGSDLINMDPTTGAFHFNGTSSGVIEAHS